MNREKSVDESWKESAAQEKERLENIARGISPPPEAPRGEGASGQEPPASSRQQPRAGDNTSGQAREEPSGAYEADFVNYITGLAYQAMIFLGEIPNPVTNAGEKNLEQAKYVIETLILLQEKTKGNLTKKESDVLNTAAYELQMKYVEVSSPGEPTGQRGTA